MTTTQIDLAAAKQKARTKSDDDLELAAGGAGNALDDILERLIADTNLSSAQKTSALQAIAVNASAIVSAAMNNQSGPTALGGSTSSTSSQSTSSGVSQQDFDNLKDEKDAAEAQIRDVHSKDRRVLEQLAHNLGMTTPANSNTAFPSDFAQRVDKEIKDRETAAAQSAAGIDQSKVVEALNEVDRAVDELRIKGALSPKIEGTDKVKVKLTEVAKAVGIQPKSGTP